MTAPADPSPPLFVDLDGTLVAGDTLWLSVRQLLTTKPWYAPALPIFLFGGRSGFKRRVAQCVTLEAGRLPYREDVVEWLRAEKQRGRTIILATAADHQIADAVSDFTGLFDHVLATEKDRNLKGRNKLAAIMEYTGNRPFDYMGDSSADLPIFEAADTAYLVHVSRRIAERVRQMPCRIGRVFE